VRGGAKARQITQFKDGRVLWPNISYDGKTIVFERDFGIWKLDLAGEKAAPIAIALRGAAAAPDVTHLTMNNQFRGQDAAGRGQGAENEGRAGRGGRGSPERPTVKPVEIVFDGIRNRLSELATGLDARIQQISPDGKTLLLSASTARQPNLYTFSLDETATEPSTEPPVARQVTSTPGAKTNAQFSPDCNCSGPYFSLNIRCKPWQADPWRCRATTQNE
jgi:hypothetical protein